MLILCTFTYNLKQMEKAAQYKATYQKLKSELVNIKDADRDSEIRRNMRLLEAMYRSITKQSITK